MFHGQLHPSFIESKINLHCYTNYIHSSGIISSEIPQNGSGLQPSPRHNRADFEEKVIDAKLPLVLQLRLLPLRFRDLLASNRRMAEEKNNMRMERFEFDGDSVPSRRQRYKMVQISVLMQIMLFEFHFFVE